MDFGTIITILIILGSFIYSTIQNYKEQDKQRPGQNRPAEEEEVPDKSPFEDLFPEPTQEKEPDPFDQRAPKPANEEPVPKEPEPTPYPKADDEYRDPFQENKTQTSQPKGSSYDASESYERPEESPFQRKQREAYKRTHQHAYKRSKKQAYQQAKQKASPGKKRRDIQKNLKQFDPVSAVIYSDILNRPKYLDDNVPPPYNRDEF